MRIKKCDICGKHFIGKSYSDKRDFCKKCYKDCIKTMR